MRVFGSKIPRVLLSVALVAGTISPAFNTESVSAAQITERTLTLQAGASDGGSLPGGVVNHLFTFTVPTDANVGSVLFEYCTIASGVCTLPTGVDTTSATLGAENGSTGFSMVNTTNGAPYLTRTAANIPADTDLTYRIDTVTNPTTANETFFVRISTFASVDTTGTPIDEGTVAASTANEIILSGTMPESLIFCTGETISSTSGIPDCTTATAGLVEFNQLFSPSDTATATSQMAASTNANNGYSITVAGTTLTSGANEIDAIATTGPGTRGVTQFGLNLVENTTATSDPLVGANVTPASDGDDLRAQPTTDYGTVDNFKFLSGDSIANSAFNTPGPTNSQIYTSSYIVNVSGSQPAGTYTTTLTYVCTATF